MQPTPESGEPETLEAFTRRLGLPFSDMLLLGRALTHRSYLNEHPEALEDNERLEFLGDAVLDFLVGAWLYNHFPEMAEGELTRLRAALVRTEQLAAFAEQIGLTKVVRLGRGEEEGGGRMRIALMCAGFEAMIGALYLNAGMPAVQTFMDPILEAASERILLHQQHRDPKSTLQELVQSRGLGPPIYQTLATTGLEHERLFEVAVVVNGEIAGRGSGRSKQIAAMAAAQNALEIMEYI